MAKAMFVSGILVAVMVQLASAQSMSVESNESVQFRQGATNQQPSTEPNNVVPEKKAPPKLGKSMTVGWLSSFEFWMSFSVLLFGLLVFAIEIVMVRLTSFRPEQTIKLLAVTLIVISTLFIITAGFDSEQIAPAMGLFGTIAGYMLGRASGKPGEVQE